MIMQTCLAVLLRRKLHQKLPSVTHWGSNLSLHFCCCHKRLQKVELDSTFRNDCGNDFIDFFTVAQYNTPVQLVSRCFVRSANQNPYYPLLGRSFASCWQSHCRCVTPVRVTAMLCVWTLRDKFHEKLSKVAAPQLIRCFKMGNQSYSGCHGNKTDSMNLLFSLIFQSEENSSSGNCALPLS